MANTITPKYLTDKGLIGALYSEDGDREAICREVLSREGLETEYPGSHEDAHDELNG